MYLFFDRPDVPDLAVHGCSGWCPLAPPCAGLGGLFFPEGRGVSIVEPKRICAGCEVRTCCTIDAVVRGDENGIWGGTSGRQRRRIRKLWLAGVPILEAIRTFAPEALSDDDTRAAG